MGVLMVIEMDPLPDRRCFLSFVHPGPMQDESMKQIPHKRIHQTGRHRGKNQRGGMVGERQGNCHANHAQQAIDLDSWIGKIAGDKLTKRHLVQAIVTAGPGSPNEFHRPITPKFVKETVYGWSVT